MSLEPAFVVMNRSRNVILADHVEVAATFWQRGRGLIGRRRLPDGFGLVIRPCSCIHMLGVLLPLDVLHVDGESRVIRILPDLKPWRVGPYVLRSNWVLELPAGTVARTATQVGDLIAIESVASAHQ